MYTLGIDEVAEVYHHIFARWFKRQVIKLLIELVDRLVEVRLVHFLPSCLQKREASIASLLCLRFLRNLLLNVFPGWVLRNFNHDRLVSPHDIGVIDHLGEIGLIIIFLSFQQRIIDPLDDAEIWLFLFRGLFYPYLLRLSSKIGFFRRDSFVYFLVCVGNRSRRILFLTEV